jgi:hypothetical protein
LRDESHKNILKVLTSLILIEIMQDNPEIRIKVYEVLNSLAVTTSVRQCLRFWKSWNDRGEIWEIIFFYNCHVKLESYIARVWVRISYLIRCGCSDTIFLKKVKIWMRLYIINKNKLLYKNKEYNKRHWMNIVWLYFGGWRTLIHI